MVIYNIFASSLNIALRSSRLLLYMINDILDFSQISNGKLRLSFSYFSLWTVIKDISKLIKFQAKEKGLEFILEKDSERDDYMIYSDQNRIKQVLLNLLGNALKFTKKGFLKVKIAEKETKKNSKGSENSRNTATPVYIVQVQDSGVGIKPADQAKLFKVFGKIDSRENKEINPGGIGLGLAISQSLIRVLNDYRKEAEITVVSELGKGSTFQFLLHSNEIQQTLATTEAKSKRFPSLEEINIIRDTIVAKKKRNISLNISSEARFQNSYVNILVVDDDQINLLVASAYLKGLKGVMFQTAFNGQDALEKIVECSNKLNQFDLILMDCNMPVLDGFAATKLIQKYFRSQRLKEPLIIACTANASEADFNLCFECGMNDYLLKPYTKLELVEKIQTYFRL